jgi:hypothetical protein
MRLSAGARVGTLHDIGEQNAVDPQLAAAGDPG